MNENYIIALILVWSLALGGLFLAIFGRVDKGHSKRKHK